MRTLRASSGIHTRCYSAEIAIAVAPIDVVQSFIAAWNANDLPRVLAHLHDDIEYHNVPMDPLHGLAAVRRYLESVGPFDWIDWKLHAIAANGSKVLTERSDDFSLRGTEIRLPLMGIFEIEGGKIRAWRDYFDLQMYRQQLARKA
jgi:limonene-1,2-epoxide hydrolase